MYMSYFLRSLFFKRKEVLIMSLVSKLDKNLSVKIPKEIMKKARLKPGAEIIWLYDENTGQILLMEKPPSFAKALKGLGKDMWQGIDPNTYVKEERDSWE
jgi:bifunctional DNA-binding transcriptional regulator/antitoxin component of YhaV-PrlF toxin-antitoxin module